MFISVNVAAWLKRPQNAIRVPSLYCHQDALTKESRWAWFVSYCCDSTTNFVDEVKSLSPPHARRLYSHWHKVNTRNDVAVFLNFLHLGCCSGRASLVAACSHVTQCECVWARSVPSQTPASSPWKLRYTVGPFADTCTKTMWLSGRLSSRAGECTT